MSERISVPPTATSLLPGKPRHGLYCSLVGGGDSEALEGFSKSPSLPLLPGEIITGLRGAARSGKPLSMENPIFRGRKYHGLFQVTHLNKGHFMSPGGTGFPCFARRKSEDKLPLEITHHTLCPGMCYQDWVWEQDGWGWGWEKLTPFQIYV